MITCYVITRKGPEVPENEWNQLSTLMEPNEFNVDSFKVKVVVGQQEQPHVITDIMEPTIKNLFLLPAIKLLQGQDYTFKYWAFNGVVNMSQLEDSVTLTGDYIGTANFTKQGLIKAFLVNAEKLMQLLLSINEQYPDFEYDSHESFESLLAEATALYNQQYN